MRTIHLNKLKEGLPVISKSRGANMAEAIAFCLIMQGFESGVTLNITGDFTEKVRIIWSDIIDEHIIKSWQIIRRSLDILFKIGILKSI